MREILFRGKRLDNGEWVEGAYLNDRDGAFYICPAASDITYGDNGNRRRIGCWYKVDPATVGQFTGLTEKNGKRIFEGDIVRHHDDNPYAIPTIFEKGEVYWDEQFCGWRRTTNGAFHRGIVDTYRMSHGCVYEVIGNIHDNPELLGGVEA